MIATPTAEAPTYDDAATIREGRAAYFAHYGFGDGGYDATWVALNKIGPFPVGFPNSAARVRAVKIHDVHHVLTGYPADYTGEAEIAAWELAAGCRGHLAAWILNLGGVVYGLFVAPRRVLAAVARGRRSLTLYEHAELPEGILDRPIGEVRAELGLSTAARGASSEASAADWATLAGLWAAGVGLFVAPLAALTAAVIAIAG